MYSQDVSLMSSAVCEEMNVRSVVTSQDKDKWGVQLKADLDYKSLGLKLKGDMQKVANAVKSMSTAALETYATTKTMDVLGYTLTDDDVLLQYTLASEGATNSEGDFEAHFDSAVIVLLDMHEDEEMLHEGLAREMLNRMQRQRKTAMLNVCGLID